MKVLGITGGVGAGKSTVLTYLAKSYGAYVIQADQVGHYLMELGQECYYQIVEVFGSGILNGDQTIHRARLGEIVFHDKAKLKKLNTIIHPAVKAYIAREIEAEQVKNTAPFIVIEAALLIEDNYDKLCTQFWYIDTPVQIRTKRLMESRGYSAEQVVKIMENQLPKMEFLKRCQFIVDNSSDFVENTYKQIDKGLVEHGFM